MAVFGASGESQNGSCATRTISSRLAGMTTSQDWLVVAEDCEALAAAAKTQANRDMLLAAAARWRRMAKVARDLDDVLREEGRKAEGPAGGAETADQTKKP